MRSPLPTLDQSPAPAIDVEGVAWARTARAWRPRFWWGGLPYLSLLAVTVFGLCGLGFWWLEPRAHSFADGLWLAFTTASTVGYGDIAPTTPAARFFAVFVVLLGFAVLSLMTAAIATLWVRTEERRIEHEILRDVHRQLKLVHVELATIRSEAAQARGLATTPAADAPLDPPASS